MPMKPLLAYFLVVLSLFPLQSSACSMYKYTVAEKTWVGNNEDSWGTDPMIWFVPGDSKKLGLVCLGYQRKFPNPDGAMNSAGLAFDAFTMPHRSNLAQRNPQMEDFSYSKLQTIMQSCKTVEEVYHYFQNKNLQVLNGSALFPGSMLLFVDKSGKYLVVEAHQLSFGNESNFALANFSYADTKDRSLVNMERYRKGISFMNRHLPEATLSYAKLLSDTMSVNREKAGDGTLYTNLFNLETGEIHLFFFHDFSKRISFKLDEELAKGAHHLAFSNLFPDNSGFKKFTSYHTPQTQRYMFYLLLLLGIFLILCAIRLASYATKAKPVSYSISVLLFALFGFLMGIYCFILVRNPGICYFPSPYEDAHSGFVSSFSYLPYLSIPVCVASAFFVFQFIKTSPIKTSFKGLLIGNQVCIFVLCCLFMYWRLLSF